MSRITNRKTGCLRWLPALAGLMGFAGDLLLGYIKPGGRGLYGMAQTGWSGMAYWRPALSMALMAIAFPLYMLGLYAAARQIASVSPATGRRFFVATGIANLGGLFIHAWFCVPQIAYRHVFDTDGPEAALALTDRIYRALGPTAAITLVVAGAALSYLFVAVLRGRTPYPRAGAVANPLVVACVTVPLWLLFRNSPAFYALMLSTPNLGFLSFFLLVAVRDIRAKREGVVWPRLGL